MRDSRVTPPKIMLQYYGWTGYLKSWGLLWLQPIGQIFGTAVAGIYLFRHRNIKPEIALALGGIGFLSFIQFAAATWGYLFIEPLILCYFLIEFAQQSTRS
jgi:hypothetical protein